MSGTVSITDGSCTVDLTTGHNVSVTHTVNNPVLIIPTVDENTNTTVSPQVAVNLSLLSIRYTVTFDLVDGIATNLMGEPDGNIHAKLRYLMKVNSNAVALFTWGTASVNVQVESLIITMNPGMIDSNGVGLTSGTLILVETMPTVH